MTALWKIERVVGYARVSTEAQDITRQIELITAYCSDRNYHLIKIIQEKISGARKDRKSLNELLDVDDAVADMIIVSELSRLSREDDILSVLSTINELLKQGVDILFWISKTAFIRLELFYPFTTSLRCQ